MMQTVTEWYRAQCGWRRECCYCCYGTGMVSAGTYDFDGPEECSGCGGGGAYWVTPRGRHVMWPGGPFL
jgi:hypothetical protein